MCRLTFALTDGAVPDSDGRGFVSPPPHSSFVCSFGTTLRFVLVMFFDELFDVLFDMALKS